MKTTDKIQLDGIAVDLEISLREYGIAWHKRGDEITFIYGIKHDGVDHTNFDHCAFDINTNLREHFNWIDASTWNEIDESCIERTIESILWLYGTENTFGTVYGEGFTFEELLEKFEI